MPEKQATSVQCILDCTAQLLECGSDNGECKPLIEEMAKAFAELTGISVEEDLNDWEDTELSSGVAISPLQAARCLNELIRTKVFIQGVAAAIKDTLNKQENAEILYAGTGPYGLLVIPFVALFPELPIKVTLLDIHQENIGSVQKLITAFGISEDKYSLEKADATTWLPEEGKRFDLIVSETMNTLLRREPQVWIFSHLQQFLKDDGELIPQRIILSAQLTGGGQQHQEQLSKVEQPAPVELGVFFELNRNVAKEIQEGNLRSFSGELALPQGCERMSRLKLNTELQVYNAYKLTENQCSLNTPVFYNDVEFRTSARLKFSYEQSPYPQFTFKLPEIDCHIPDFDEIGRLGIYQIKRIWKKYQLSRQGLIDRNMLEREWELDGMLFNELGLGLEPALQFIHQRGSFERFEDWITQVNNGNLNESLISRINTNVAAFINPAMAKSAAQKNKECYQLTQKQWQDWHENGLLVIPGVIDRDLCEQACEVIYDYLGISPDEPDTWGRASAKMQHIMVQLFRHPILDEIRETQKIKDIFRQIWQMDTLSLSTDRVSFNPPESSKWIFPGPGIHWDINLDKPIEFDTQGLIYLTDTTENQGAFRCVPGFHHKIENWLRELPEGTEPRQQILLDHPPEAVVAEAGSLIIWHSALPHGSGPNSADTPRMVQYINMRPVPSCEHN